MEEKLERRVREEIIRRVLEREETDQEEARRAMNDQATLETLEAFSSLPPGEIRKIAREVRARYGRTAPPPVMRFKETIRILSLLAFLLSAAMAGHHFFRADSPDPAAGRPPAVGSRPLDDRQAAGRSGEAIRPGSERPANRPLEAIGSGPVPAYDEEALKGALPVHISIAGDGFLPVGMTVAARWNQPTPLSDEPPAEILAEPRYSGKGRRYGRIRLGEGGRRVFPFAFDGVAGGGLRLYFDLNMNGDLRDDGAPLENEGSSIFARRISIPFSRILPEADLPGSHTLWFFTNDTLWKRGRIGHYSRTQLKGAVTLSGRRYTAFLADEGDNDADFTNDGISIDLDGNGSIDDRLERFPPGKAAFIAGTAHNFIIGW